MNKTRRYTVPASLAMILVALVAFPAYQLMTGGNASNRLSVGMGDLHLYEAQQAAQVNEGQESSNPRVGMGDLHLYEAQSYVPVTGMSKTSAPAVGMGDLHLYEYQQLIQSRE